MAVTQSNGLNRGVTDPATYPESVGSDDIRRDIDRTRTEMDRTIDELGERLRPQSLFDELVASVRGSLFASSGAACGTTSGVSSRQMSEQVSDVTSRMGRSLIEAVRENPVPAALMGAGLAWLLFEDKAERAYRRRRIESHVRGYTGDRFTDPGTHSGSYVDARTGKPYDESYGAGYEDRDYDGEPDVCPPSMMDKASSAASSVKETLGSAAHAIGSAAGAVGGAASKAAHGAKSLAGKTGHAAASTGRSVRSAGHTVGEYGRTAGHSMHHAGSSMREYGHTTAESMRHYGHVAADKTRHGYAVSRDRFNDALDEKPLAVGVAALAAGLLAGFALPHTRTEDRTIGRTSDRMKDEAKRRGREAVEQGKEVASHIAGEALGEAEGQGLTPGSLGEKVSRVAKDALHAAKESAQREGIDPHSLGEKAQFVGQAVKEKGKEEWRHSKSDTSGTTWSSGDVGDVATTSLPATGAMGLTDTSGEAGLACGTETGTLGGAKAGGMSDIGSGYAPNVQGDTRSGKEEAEIKHDIAEGMSASSEKSVQDKSKAKGADDLGDSCRR